MNRDRRNIEAFMALVRAGLWEMDIQNLSAQDVNFAAVQKLADEQAVVGLVAAGMEYMAHPNFFRHDMFALIGQTMQLEQRNVAMNHFVVGLAKKLQQAGIFAVLVKGQGVAQCYERPLWRACGDVDLLLDSENYERAKSFLTPFASQVDVEDTDYMHLGMTIHSWIVELHGTLFTQISSRINQVVKSIQGELFSNKQVRPWEIDGTTVFLPNPDDDVLVIFTHFINHFFIGGVGLRQICDWCRLLWTYRLDIDRNKLWERLRKMNLLSEWQAFGAFAVEYLGMPEEAMPFYEESRRWKRKAKIIFSHILKTGNFGHNQDNSYRQKHSPIVSDFLTFCRRVVDYLGMLVIFPIDAPLFFMHYVANRIKTRV